MLSAAASGDRLRLCSTAKGASTGELFDYICVIVLTSKISAQTKTARDGGGILAPLHAYPCVYLEKTSVDLSRRNGVRRRHPARVPGARSLSRAIS